MYIQRDIIPELLNYLDLGKILILKGARQVGKTTIMKKIQEHLSSIGKNTFYTSADEDFSNSILKSPRHLIVRLETEFQLQNSDKAYVFIDEFQYIKDPGLFIKVLHDQYGKQIQIIVSGSSSLEITKNSEFLTGRKIQFSIQRISFKEFVRFMQPNIEKAFRPPYNYDKWKILYEVHEPELKILLTQFAAFGGYPEIVTTQENRLKKRLLRELSLSYIQKDIIGFLKVGNVKAFQGLLKILCAETANLINKQSLSATLGISINTLNKYLDILEGTYLCSFVKPFYSNIRKEVSKMTKVFLLDNGLRNFVLNRSIETYNDINGQDAENIAFLSLQSLVPEEQLFYFRTIGKAEIDFIIDNGETKQAIEIKFQNNPNRLPVAMRNFSKKYKTTKFIIVTKNTFKENQDSLYIPLPVFDFFLNSLMS